MLVTRGRRRLCKMGASTPCYPTWTMLQICCPGTVPSGGGNSAVSDYRADIELHYTTPQQVEKVFAPVSCCIADEELRKQTVPALQEKVGRW